MRLFLLPISTRRALIYSERIPQRPDAKLSIVDRVINKSSETWARWEKEEGGWKRWVTRKGESIFKRIPYEEWGLKSIPALSERRKIALKEGKENAEVLFPGLFLNEAKVPEILRQLAQERQSLHRKRLIWSIVGMPISAPFALVPIVPNLPFFYLVFRAYSHWKALSGSRHLEYLVNSSLFKSTPSTVLDELYAAGLMHPTREKSRNEPNPTLEEARKVADLVTAQTKDGTEDVMLLKAWNGKLIAERFNLPEMRVEIERAVNQVEASIKAKEELEDEKAHIEKATARPVEEKTEERKT